MNNPFEEIARRLSAIEFAIETLKAPQPTRAAKQNPPARPTPANVFRGNLGKRNYMIDGCEVIPFRILMEDPAVKGNYIIHYEYTRFDGTEYDSVRLDNTRHFTDEVAAIKKLIKEMTKQVEDLKLYLKEIEE